MLSTLVLLAVSGTVSSTLAANEVDAKLRIDLEHIAQKRIFFGHQSVGENLLEGIRQLSTMTGIPVNIVQTPTAQEVKPATFGNTYIAENGNPLMKLHSFETALGNKPSGIDIAMMKFCYVDIKADTDVKSLFSHYRTTIETLQKKNPNTTFVHITVPLTSEQSGLKALLKRILGRGNSIVNSHRQEYNELLRIAYQGREPIFDLAKVESTSPDGKEVTVNWKGKVIPVMDSVYTSDGGHLNEMGKLRAARELASALASIPSQPPVRNLTH